LVTYVQDYDLKRMTCKELLTKFSLINTSCNLLANGVALLPDYEHKPALELVVRCKKYADAQLYHNTPPFLYATEDLRKAICKLYYTQFFLNKPIEEITFKGDRVTGVRSEGKVYKCKKLVGDPSYFPNLVQKVGSISRCVCILEQTRGTIDSAYLVLPANNIQNAHGQQGNGTYNNDR
jgi:Rab GDP dissociation inhibitor